jgi:hypothetical protein
MAMDLKALREQVLEATTRHFWDTKGFVPDEDSEEWEAEYRRQFELAKARPAPSDPAVVPAAPPPVRAASRALPELSGAPAQKRWAETLRAERLEEIEDEALRDWLAGAWTTAKSWVDSRDLPGPTFLRRIKAEQAEHRRQSLKEAASSAAEQQTKAAAGAAVQHDIEAAGITVAGLIELVDVSPRAAPAPLRDKLAELAAAGRHLRVFETSNPAVLAVLEKNETGRTDYAIERDAGLVADLRLFARSVGV